MNKLFTVNMINWFKKLFKESQKVTTEWDHFSWWKTSCGDNKISVRTSIKDKYDCFSYQELELDAEGLDIVDDLKKWINRNLK